MAVFSAFFDVNVSGGAGLVGEHCVAVVIVLFVTVLKG
jgi:hypothetical protein